MVCDNAIQKKKHNFFVTPQMPQRQPKYQMLTFEVWLEKIVNEFSLY